MDIPNLYLELSFPIRFIKMCIRNYSAIFAEE